MEAGSIMCKVSASGTTIVQGRAGQSGETLPRRATKGYASGSGGGTDRQWPRPVVGSRPVSGVVTVLYLLGGSLHEVDDLLVGSICPRPLCGVLGCIPSDPTSIELASYWMLIGSPSMVCCHSAAMASRISPVTTALSFCYSSNGHSAHKTTKRAPVARTFPVSIIPSPSTSRPIMRQPSSMP